MSVDMAKEFLAKIATDEGTAAKAKGLAGSALVALAQRMGYTFNEADLLKASSGVADPTALSDTVLDRVSGGLNRTGRYSR